MIRDIYSSTSSEKSFIYDPVVLQWDFLSMNICESYYDRVGLMTMFRYEVLLPAIKISAYVETLKNTPI